MISAITAHTPKHHSFVHVSMGKRRYFNVIHTVDYGKGVHLHAQVHLKMIITNPVKRIDQMVARILIAVDGSVTAENALREAIHLGTKLNAELHALYVAPSENYPLTPPSPAFSRIDPTYDMLGKIVDEEIEHIQQRIGEIATETGGDITIHIQRGDPRNEIIHLAEQLGVDLVVLGSVGRSRLDRLLLGSVSSYVVEHSPISTLVVRP
jgi:nucleotide-binding universal stress UspA family protein